MAEGRDTADLLRTLFPRPGETIRKSEDLQAQVDQLIQMGLAEEVGDDRYQLTAMGKALTEKSLPNMGKPEDAVKILDDLRRMRGELDESDAMLKVQVDATLASGVSLDVILEAMGMTEDEFMEWRQQFFPPDLVGTEPIRVAHTDELLRMVETADRRDFNRQLTREAVARIAPDSFHTVRPILDHSQERADLGDHWRAQVHVQYVDRAEPEVSILDFDVDEVKALLTGTEFQRMMDDPVLKMQKGDGGDPILGELKCDFCSSRPTTWEYFADDFTLPGIEAEQRYGTIVHSGEWGSRGSWSACERCKELIDQGRHADMIDRMYRNFFAREPELRRLARAQRDLVRGMFERMYNGFRNHRKGPGRAEIHAPGRHKLLVSAMLLELTGEAPSAQEPLVVRAMQQLWKPDLMRKEEVWSAFIALLRTAEIFILDKDSSMAAIRAEAPPTKEFPPLPYKRCIVEFISDGKPAAFSDRISTEGNEDPEEDVRVDVRVVDWPILCIGIVEHEVGRLWDVFTPIWNPETRSLAPVPFRVSPGSIMGPREVDGQEGVHELSEQMRESVYDTVLNVVHLITARNVPRNEVRLPRPQRRGLAREYSWEEPRIYYVDLWNAGDRAAHGEDRSREYHVRWMVRGHWRHDWSHQGWGDHRCSCPDGTHERNVLAKWIESYVKGPPGAPFKGKPVYKQRGELSRA